MVIFRRQGYTKYKKLGSKWRRPKGLQSKMRKCKKSHQKMPNIGRGTKSKEIIPVISNEKEVGKNEIILEGAEHLQVYFASSVGKKKRKEIMKKHKKVVFVNASK